jgi:GR25 family glycosyltransferase involved in LPS biosynthesis
MLINPFKIPVYYINLDEDTERNIAVVKRLKNYGFSQDLVSRISGIRKPGIPQDSVFIGCFHSQLKALKEGLSKGVPFMVLEDDVVVNQIPEILDLPEDTDVLYVGVSSWAFTPESEMNLATHGRIIKDRFNNDLVRIFNMLSSHAILYVNMEYVQALVDELEKNLDGIPIMSNNLGTPMRYYNGIQLPVDVIMANQQYKGKAYALRNPIFYQDDKHKYCTLITL